MTNPKLRRARPPLTPVLAAAAMAGCSSEDSVLDPASDAAERVADLSWVMFVTSTAITLVVFALLGYGLVRRRRQGAASSDRGAERWIIAGGVVLPIVVLTPVAALGVSVLNDQQEGTLHVEVTGHQYWWEYRYPDLGVVTANELHIPVDRPVELTLRSDDVIHSLWVPALGGKTDLVPGHANTMTLEAGSVGTYQGKCAEFCGLQHAKMLFLVIAQPQAEFDRWVEDQRAPASPEAASSQGAELFAREGCASCHTVRGTGADGRLGPDLTHIASRRTLAAGVLRNTPQNMRRWIDHTWEVKDEIVMPPVPLTDEEVDAVVSYMEALE